MFANPPTDQPTPSACSLRSRARVNIYDSYDSSDHLSLVRPTARVRSGRAAAEFESDCLCESVSVFLVCLAIHKHIYAQENRKIAPVA